MATIIVNRSWLSAPIDRPMVATITSVEPRAFMPVASASASRRVSPPSSPPRKAPPNFPMRGDGDQPERQQQKLRVLEHRDEIGAQARGAEEHRHEEGDDQSAQLLVDVPRQDRRFADQDAGDEGAEHGMHADHVRGQRHQPHDHQDRGDDGEFADEGVVDPADRQRHQPPADGQAERHEGERADDALGDAQRIDVALQRQAEDHRDDDPADGVVDDGGAEDDLADGAAQEVHLAHHGGDDLDRGDRQRGAEEQRRDQPLARDPGAWRRAGIRRARSRRRTE